MSKNIITFEAQNEHVWKVREKPIPASKAIPKWWKDIPKYSTENGKLSISPRANVTVKECAPTKDMLMSGYIITLWTDLLVTKTDGEQTIQWITSYPPIEKWGSHQVAGYEVPKGCSPDVFKYLHGWTVKTPPGWSTLYMQPVGYQNNPIKVINGIVDTDILHSEINIPFFIDKDFEGIIEKGLPIVQIIPIKRAVWESKTEFINNEKHQYNLEKIRTKIYGYYSSIREKKIYK
jgi:hypothetical protein